MKNNLLIILLFISYVSFAQSYGLITTDVNSRIEAGGEKLRVIKKGQLVEILQSNGKWSFVKDLSVNKKGWVSKKYILKNIAILKSDANSRKSPGGNKLRVIKKGQIVELLQSKGSWVFVRDISVNKKGWVSKSLLSGSSLNNSLSSSEINLNDPKVYNPPNCDYTITSPRNGDKNVKTNPAIIKWTHATGSPNGYYFSISKISNGKLNYVKKPDGDLINNLDIGYVNSFSVSNLESNTQYFIGLIPYNEIGKAKDCDGLFSFTTGNAIISDDTTTSSDKIIEKRLTEMGILWKWRNFNKTSLKRISMTDNQRKFFIDEVLSWKGVPYGFGGTNRNGVDCSGLIWRGLRQAIDYNGEKLNAQGWAQSGKLIPKKNSLIPGDLVCFSNIPGGSNRLVQHIAIYIGKGKFWHAPSSGKVVSTAELENTYWKTKFIFGIRY